MKKKLRLLFYKHGVQHQTERQSMQVEIVATITFPDGSVVTILGEKIQYKSAKEESVTLKKIHEYKLETIHGGDKGGNTGSSDANANEGGGSQAGVLAHTKTQNSELNHKLLSNQLLKKNHKNATEKAKPDKQDEIKGAPLSEKEKAQNFQQEWKQKNKQLSKRLKMRKL